MKPKEKETYKSKNKEINFSVVFSENGDSFQDIMEKILINKICENK